MTRAACNGFITYVPIVLVEVRIRRNNECGLHWPGPIHYISGATQRIAVDLLVAAQPIFVRCAGTASTCQSVRCGSVLILGGAR